MSWILCSPQRSQPQPGGGVLLGGVRSSWARPREGAPGWSVITHTDDNGTHTAVLTTPAGHTYQSTAPPIAGPPARVDTGLMETSIGVALARHAA